MIVSLGSLGQVSSVMVTPTACTNPKWWRLCRGCSSVKCAPEASLLWPSPLRDRYECGTLEKCIIMFLLVECMTVCGVLVSQVYAWGCGACLGCGSSEATALRPKLIEELATTRVVDISIGDSHCLALSHGKIPHTPRNSMIYSQLSTHGAGR